MVPTADSTTPMDQRSVRRSVGPLGVWEEVKLILGTIRQQIPPLRPTDGSTVGPSVGWTVGDLGNSFRKLSKVWEKVTLVTNGTVGWSAGWKIREENKQNERV